MSTVCNCHGFVFTDCPNRKPVAAPSREERLEKALEEALELIWEHHNIRFIRESAEHLTGSCELCKDGRYQRLAAALGLPEERTKS